MDTFRTTLAFSPAAHKITLQTHILSVGSCFAQVMGERLLGNKFSALVNPFGIIFNPVSLCKLLHLAVDNGTLSPDLMVEGEGQWHHYDLHSRLYETSAQQLLQKGQDVLKEAHDFWQQTDCLMITLGTAFVYKLKSMDCIVANCHKVPAARFTKALLSLDQIIEPLTALLEKLFSQKPHLKVILTVSPVRHIKDTIPLNTVSKSLLRVACHQLVSQYKQVEYFASYEIMMDDLRDYRFYKSDMIHPSEVAEEYIWNAFSDMYLDQEAKDFIKKWGKLKQAIAHRPLHPQSEAHQKFLKETISKLKALKGLVQIENEIQYLEQQLTNLPQGLSTKSL